MFDPHLTFQTESARVFSICWSLWIKILNSSNFSNQSAKGYGFFGHLRLGGTLVVHCFLTKI